jgi:hypothetical protein
MDFDLIGASPHLGLNICSPHNNPIFRPWEMGFLGGTRTRTH